MTNTAPTAKQLALLATATVETYEMWDNENGHSGGTFTGHVVRANDNALFPLYLAGLLGRRAVGKGKSVRPLTAEGLRAAGLA